jgi:uncharacterized protein
MTALLSGLLFGIGLAVSGMTQPDKIIGFLDVFGTWDPTLAFVMGGALATHLTSAALVRRRRAPIYATRFEQPARRSPDASLVGGSALFGVGWALVGFCPGPSFVALASLDPQPLIFVPAMLAGMALYGATRPVPEKATAPTEEPCG